MKCVKFKGVQESQCVLCSERASGLLCVHTHGYSCYLGGDSVRSPGPQKGVHCQGVNSFSRNRFLANHPLGLRSDQCTSTTKDRMNVSGTLLISFKKKLLFLGSVSCSCWNEIKHTIKQKHKYTSPFRSILCLPPEKMGQEAKIQHPDVPQLF